jgi:hypothetical protein
MRKSKLIHIKLTHHVVMYMIVVDIQIQHELQHVVNHYNMSHGLLHKHYNEGLGIQGGFLHKNAHNLACIS